MEYILSNNNYKFKYKFTKILIIMYIHMYRRMSFYVF